MVCAFVTNQLLHDATAKPASTTTSQQSVDSVGLINSLVTVLKALEIYQSKTTVVSTLNNVHSERSRFVIVSCGPTHGCHALYQPFYRGHMSPFALRSQRTVRQSRR